VILGLRINVLADQFPVRVANCTSAVTSALGDDAARPQQVASMLHAVAVGADESVDDLFWG
jgi:hypothetical protein